MKILVLDYYGTDGALDFCMRCIRDGHKVKWHFKPDFRSETVGDGLVEKVDDWRDWMRWADLVVLADNTKYLREIDAWRQNEDVCIVGASSEAATWELDRKTGQEMFKKVGIPVPAFKEFSDYDAAIAFVKKENRPFVSKPSYDESDKSLSYVGKTPADLIYMLGRWKKQQKLKGSFILQEKVSGCEMAVGGWFGPHGFNEGWCENWEFKSLMAGDKGPNVGEMGTVLRYVKTSKLANKVLRPLEDELHKLNYCGYVDVNCIIDDKGQPWPLEFTMRMGWPTFNIQQRLVAGDHAEWLLALGSGRDSRPFLLDKISCGVVMALPEFPYQKSSPQNVCGVPIYGLEPSRMKGVHLCQASMGSAPQDKDGQVVDGPCMVTAGDYVLVGSGIGETVKQARGRAYQVLDRISAPASPFWRPDIGERLKTQIPEVQKFGFATGMQF